MICCLPTFLSLVFLHLSPPSLLSLPQAEWEARQAAEAALDAAGDAPAEEEAADAADKDHWEEEKELCKQLLMYLRRLVPAEKAVEEEVEVGGIDPERRIETEEDNGRSLGMCDFFARWFLELKWQRCPI